MDTKVLMIVFIVMSAAEIIFVCHICDDTFAMNAYFRLAGMRAKGAHWFFDEVNIYRNIFKNHTPGAKIKYSIYNCDPINSY